MTFALGQCFELVYGNDQNPRFPELRHPKSVALRSIMTLEINEIDNLAPIDRFMSFKWCITFLLSRMHNYTGQVIPGINSIIPPCPSLDKPRDRFRWFVA